MKKSNTKKASDTGCVTKTQLITSAPQEENASISALTNVSRKNLEKRVHQQTDELESKGQQLKQGVAREKVAQEQIHIRNKAMDSAQDGIFIINAQKINFPVIYANSSFRNLTGYTKEQVLGKDYFHLYGTGADVRVIEEIKHTLQKGNSFHGEMLSFKKNGKKFWSLLRITPVRDVKGATTHYVGIQTDTTLIKQRNLEIEEQREELLHVTRVGKLAEFVSSLAHEISQPLTAILSYTQAAQRLLSDREPQVQEILQYIVDDDQRAVEVIRRLRLLLKKSKPTFEPLDMNLLIHDTVKLIMTHITVRHKTIKFELADQLPLIRGDRIQLQQVLLNLISNSLEAMESNKESIELLIRTSSHVSGAVLVEVKDSGPGISTKNMSKVFTHFFTSKTNGLGMGLPISRSIIEAHGGWLNAKNNAKGGGVTFNFTLPALAKEKNSDE